MSTTETDALAEVLTTDEAATRLRSRRNAAYAAAREWRATGGMAGHPVHRDRPHPPRPARRPQSAARTDRLTALCPRNPRI